LEKKMMMTFNPNTRKKHVFAQSVKMQNFAKKTKKAYKYHGTTFVKNPFDYAMYMRRAGTLCLRRRLPPPPPHHHSSSSSEL
jgi:hypothetical protein